MAQKYIDVAEKALQAMKAIPGTIRARLLY